MCLWGYCSWRWDPVLHFYFPNKCIFFYFAEGMFPAAKASNDMNQYGNVILLEIQLGFFRILIWIQLPEGQLAGVTWMWHTDPRWPGIVSCLLEWHCHFTNVLGHQLLYRIIVHNTWGSIWPPNSTDNELFKGHLQKIYNYCQAVEAMGNRHNV